MFNLGYYHDMLRAAILCVVSAVVQSQSCASFPAAYSGGLCDGTKLLFKKCLPAGQSAPTSILINGSHFTAASCQSEMSSVCTALQGSFNPDYCQMFLRSGALDSSSTGSSFPADSSMPVPLAVPFCRNLAASTVSTSAGLCTSDADCKTIVM